MTFLNNGRPTNVLGKFCDKSLKLLVPRQYFNYVKENHYKNYARGSVDQAVKPLFDELVEDGCVTIRGAVPPDACTAIEHQIRPLFQDIKRGQATEKMKYHRFDDYGVYRIADVDKLCSKSEKFFDLEVVRQLATAYLGRGADSYVRMAEWKPCEGKSSSSDVPHFDDWRHRFKAFLYLTDVEEGDAPFIYYKKSHTNAAWRDFKELQYFRYGRVNEAWKHGYYGHFTTDEMKKFEIDRKYEKIVCTGLRGTLILADTRGIHSGTPPKNGERLLLASFFDIR